jgi:hypothetical protein
MTEQTGSYKKHLHLDSLVALLAVALLVLSPYLTTGYYQDDGLNSTLSGHLLRRGLTIMEFLRAQNHSWMFDNGRLFPIALTGYFWWWLNPPLWLYRVVQVASVLVCMGLWVRVLETLGSSRRFAILSALCVLPCLQMRDYHDPVTSYTFLLQWVFIQAAGSVWLYRKYQLKAPRWTLWASLILFATSLLTYETSLAFYPILAVLALFDRSGRSHGAARWGHTVIVAIYLISVGWLRSHAPVSYPGTQSTLTFKSVSTFIYQLSGVFPMIYAIFGRSGIYSGETLFTSAFWTPFWPIASSGAMVGILAYHVLKRDNTPPTSDRPSLSLIRWSAAAIWILPSALVALSVKYQMEINRPGKAYLPVFLSYFGFSVFLALGLRRLKERTSTAIAAGLLGVLTTLTVAANHMAARKLNAIDKDPRVLVEKAFKEGLLADLPQDTILGVSIEGGWFSPDFMFTHAGRTLAIARHDGWLGPPPAQPKTKWLEIDVAHKTVRLQPGI